MANDPGVEQFWAAFLKDTGRPENLRPTDVFSFGMDAGLAESLLALVLAGEKTATCSSFTGRQIDGDPIPKAGDLSVVTDAAGTPRCVIETTAAATLPFEAVTWEMARREGEDENLESWRENHIHFFTLEAQQGSYSFTWSMPVVFEDFRVVYRGQVE